MSRRSFTLINKFVRTPTVDIRFGGGAEIWTYWVDPRGSIPEDVRRAMGVHQLQLLATEEDNSHGVFRPSPSGPRSTARVARDHAYDDRMFTSVMSQVDRQVELSLRRLVKLVRRSHESHSHQAERVVMVAEDLRARRIEFNTSLYRQVPRDDQRFTLLAYQLNKHFGNINQKLPFVNIPAAGGSRSTPRRGTERGGGGCR